METIYEVNRKKTKKAKKAKGKKAKTATRKKTRKSKTGLSADARGILQYLEGGGATIARNYPSQVVPAKPAGQQANELAFRLQLPNTQMAGLMRQMFAGRQQLPRQMGQQTTQLFRDQQFQQAVDLKGQIQAEKTERQRLETKVANDELVFRQALTNQETRANTLANQLQNTQAGLGRSISPPPSPRMRGGGGGAVAGGGLGFGSIGRSPYLSRANSVAGEGLDIAFMESEQESLSPQYSSDFPPPPADYLRRVSPEQSSESSGETIDPRKLDAVLNATERGISGRIGEIHRENYIRNAPTGRVVLPDKPYAERRPRRSSRQPKPNPRFQQEEPFPSAGGGASAVQTPFGGVAVRVPDLRREISRISGIPQSRIKISSAGRGARAELAGLRDEVQGFASRGLSQSQAVEQLKARARVRFEE
jgi:hypothetical protein